MGLIKSKSVRKARRAARKQKRAARAAARGNQKRADRLNKKADKLIAQAGNAAPLLRLVIDEGSYKLTTEERQNIVDAIKFLRQTSAPKINATLNYYDGLNEASLIDNWNSSKLGQIFGHITKEKYYKKFRRRAKRITDTLLNQMLIIRVVDGTKKRWVGKATPTGILNRPFTRNVRIHLAMNLSYHKGEYLRDTIVHEIAHTFNANTAHSDDDLEDTTTKAALRQPERYAQAFETV